MEPGGRSKRSAGERILVRKRLVKGFFGLGLPKFARRVNCRHVVHDRLGDSHPKLQVQRVTEDQAEISTNRRTVGNPADQLIDKKSVCSWMVTMRFTRFPERFLSSK